MRFAAWILAGLLIPTLLAGCSPLERWESMNQQTARLFHDGQYTAALEQARRTLTFAQKKFGENHRFTSTVLSNLIFLYSLVGQYGQAETIIQQLLQKSALSPQPLETRGVLLTRLSEIYRFQGKYALAEKTGQAAIRVLEESFPPNHSLISMAWNNLAFILDSQKKFPAAEQAYQKVLTLREKALGPSHPELESPLINLENLYRKEGKIPEAIVLSQRRLALQDTPAGAPRSGSFAQSRLNLAALYLSSGRAAEAEPLARQALEQDQKNLGLLHERVATDLDLLARIMAAQNQPNAAETFWKRALDIQKNCLPPGHPHRAAVLENYCRWLKSQNRLADAAALEPTPVKK